MAALVVCPFCQSPRVIALAIEGVHQDVTRFSCGGCERTWAELATRPKRALARVAAAVSPRGRMDDEDESKGGRRT
jgi:transposase-like protein